MFTTAGAVRPPDTEQTCSVCGAGFWTYNASKTGISYKEYYNVADIPNLEDTEGGCYTDADVALVLYNNDIICFSCLDKKVAEYKAANANNLSAPGTGNTPITVTAAASTFNVTVPTSIPLVVNADGTVTAPTGVKLVNGSAGSVQVSSIAMNNGDWALTDYNGGNRSKLAEAKVDSKKLGLSLAVTGNAAVTSKDGSQNPTIDTSKWTMPGGSELPISVGAIATASSTKVTAEVTAANVVFTLAWK